MGKDSPPPPPDYSGIAAASAASAATSAKIAADQLAWAKKTYAENKKVTDKVVDAALKTMEFNDENARKDRARYEQIFQPLENDLAKDAADYNTVGRRESEAGAAQADVSTQFAAARTAAQDRLESFGIDPSQTRSAALDVSARMQEAAARAGAGNQARRQVEATGRQLRTEAINVGKGYPAQVAGEFGTAGAAGTQGAGTALNQTQTGASTMGTGAQWTGLENSSLGTWGGALTSGYNAQMQDYKAQQDNGWGQILGLAAGTGMKLATGGFFQEGGPTADVGPAHQGVPITKDMSPSNGAATDDVHVQANVGEFIIPEDVTRWFGEKHFQKMIEKGREEKTGAPAKPRAGAVPINSMPAVNTAQAAALPV